MFKLMISLFLTFPSIGLAMFGDVDCENQSKQTRLTTLKVRHFGQNADLFSQMNINTVAKSVTEWVYGPRTMNYIKTAPRRYEAKGLSLTIFPNGTAISETYSPGYEGVPAGFSETFICKDAFK